MNIYVIYLLYCHGDEIIYEAFHKRQIYGATEILELVFFGFGFLVF